MAMNFVTTPANGTVSGNYTYDSSIPGWRKTPENSASLPAGSIMQWATATAPANWLICDGSAVSRTNYASLFAAIGVQFGSGNGTTTFNLPDLRGRVAVGRDASQTEFDTLGETGGAKTHTLTTAEMPSHTHIQDSHNHTQNPHNHSGGDNGHSHSTYGNTGSGVADGGNSNYLTQLQRYFSTATGYASIYINNTTATNNATTATNQNTGGGGAHNNLQPYIVLNYIIKTSAGITSGDSELATRVGAIETSTVRSVTLGGTGSSTIAGAQANLQIPLGHNYALNGGFDINQRGTTFTPNGGALYCSDRWIASGMNSANIYNVGTSELPQTGLVTYLRMSRTSNVGNYPAIETHLEDVRTLAGATITVSFYARQNIAWNAGTWYVGYYQNFGTGGSSGVGNFAVQAFPSLTSSWQRYSFTFTVPDISGKTVGPSSYLQILMRNDSASQTAGETDITGVQVEVGSSATVYRRTYPTLQGELLACQRFFQIWTPSTFQGDLAKLSPSASNSAYGGMNLHVPMRVAPTMSYSSANVVRYHVPGIIIGECPSMSFDSSIHSLNVAVGGANMSYGQQVALQWTTTTGYIYASAEI